MGRRRVAAKRDLLPDPKFGSDLIARFVNVLMKNGKKSIAQSLFYGAVTKAALGEQVVKGSKLTDGSIAKVLEFFNKVIENLRPTVEVKARRVGGATYQVPVEVRWERSLALAMRWLIQASRSRGEKGGMMARLAAEMEDAFNGRGAAIKKREDMIKMANANKAFVHLG